MLRVEEQLQEYGEKLDDHDRDLYGDMRRGRPGLTQQVRNTYIVMVAILFLLTVLTILQILVIVGVL